VLRTSGRVFTSERPTFPTQSRILDKFHCTLATE
jgi:hypothetical protein